MLAEPLALNFDETSRWQVTSRFGRQPSFHLAQGAAIAAKMRAP